MWVVVWLIAAKLHFHPPGHFINRTLYLQLICLSVRLSSSWCLGYCFALEARAQPVPCRSLAQLLQRVARSLLPPAALALASFCLSLLLALGARGFLVAAAAAAAVTATSADAGHFAGALRESRSKAPQVADSQLRG